MLLSMEKTTRASKYMYSMFSIKMTITEDMIIYSSHICQFKNQCINRLTQNKRETSLISYHIKLISFPMSFDEFLNHTSFKRKHLNCANLCRRRCVYVPCYSYMHRTAIAVLFQGNLFDYHMFFRPIVTSNIAHRLAES